MDTSTRRLWRWAPAAVAVVATVFAGGLALGAALSMRTSAGTTATVVAGRPVARAVSSLTVNQIYTRVSAGVVTLSVRGISSDPWGRTRESEAEGSGFVVDARGDIVTNSHVVGGADTITVTFKNGATARADLVGSDPSTDIAVVRVTPGSVKLTPLAFANSSAVKVGDGVVAIGSPFGLPQTVTTGVVSAVGRTIEAPDGSAIRGVIQTDAAINSGNSGGPLLDVNGKVIGVTSQIASKSGGSDGVGFAVSSNSVKTVVASIVGGV